MYLSALRHHHIAYDILEPDRTKMPKLKLVDSGIRRTKARTPKQIRLPVTPDILRQVYKHWYSSQHDYETIMLWSVSTLCFFGFFRLGELLSPTNTKYDASSHLSFGDVAVDSHSSPSLVKIHIKTSKTDQEQEGADIYVGKTGDILCPVAALLAYLAVRGASPGPLFQLQDRTPLTKDYTSYRSSLTDIGLEASQYAGRSFRIGAATTAAEKGIEDSLIKAMGRWKSQPYLTYTC